MFSFQNLSPKKLALLIGLCLSIPLGLVVWWITGLGWAGLLAAGLNMIAAYLLVYYLTENFIYRKIKLIFKFIYDTKADKREEMYYKYILPRKSLEEVRGDVEDWAVQKSFEVETLKKNESFRKEFLQNLSHEFKTPVFSIQGYVETLLDGALDNPELSRKFLGKTHKNIERVVALIKDLDEITRLESGAQLLNRENYVIQEQIKEVFDSLSGAAATQEMRCSLKKDSEAPVTIYADREKIGRVLTNLVQNAINYGKYGGHILAGVYKTDDKTVLIEISDNGQGIDEKSLPRIFERFYRTDEGRSLHARGSGLGLSISKHIIEAHGQNIHARSKRDVGTTIGFTLPVGRGRS